MPQYESGKCPAYSLNRTGGCEVGCYVEASGSIVSAGWDDKVMFCEGHEGARMAAEANEPTERALFV